MPLPLLPLIGLGANLISNVFNTTQQNRQNRKSQDFSREMYDRQRRDALTDTQMQNDYNSPAAQMARLKAAGLNPNLVYGDGATQQAAPVRSSSVEGAKFEAPQTNAGGIQSGLMDIYDVKVKQAQANNLDANSRTAAADALLRVQQTAQSAAQTASLQMSTAKTEIEKGLAALHLRQAGELNQTTIETAKQNLLKMQADTIYTLNQDDRATALNSASVQEAMQRILTLRKGRAKTDAEIQHIDAMIKNIGQDTKIKAADALLKQNGIQPHDQAYQRYIQNQIKKADNALKFWKNKPAKQFSSGGLRSGIKSQLKKRK